MKTRIRLWVKIVILIIVLILLLFIYTRYINTSGFKVKEYLIASNVEEEFNGFKIVQISDINYKHTTSKNDLKKIIKRINLINPDIVVFTGDLLNDSIIYTDEDIKDITKLLSSIDAKIEKIAIKGEEDIDSKYFNNIMTNSNFKILDNEYELIYNKSNTPILISGISNIDNNINSTIEYLDNNNVFSILLIHKPDEIENIEYDKFNLILAGHSLNGSINIPVIKNLFLADGAKKYYENYYKLGNTKMYISSGIGTKNFKFRFLNKPSINFYRIKKK